MWIPKTLLPEGFFFVYFARSIMDNSPWSVTWDRARGRMADGACWVELTRQFWIEEIGRYVTELDCGLYGPVDAWE